MSLPNCSPISPNSEEFTALQFRLRLATRSTGLVLRRAFAVNAVPQVVAPPRRPPKILEAWLDASRLPAPNSLTNACARGLTIPPRGGLSVHVGNLSHLVAQDGWDDDENRTVVTSSATTEKIQRFLLCDFLLNKGYLIDPGTSALRSLGADDLPQNYDAFYLRRAETAAGPVDATPGLSQLNSPRSSVFGACDEQGYFRHEYITFDSTRVVPRFVLEFEVDSSAEATQLQDHVARKICEGCRAAPATLWCELEKIQLCKVCDRDVHSHPLTQRHRRVPLSEEHTRLHLRASCAAHSDRLAEFYCEPCKKVLCVDCKVSGSHSSGPCSTHHLHPLRDLYADVVHKTSEVDARDPESEVYRRTISRQAGALSAELAKVEVRGREAEEEIRAAAERALASVRQIVSAKSKILKSDMAELQRQRDQLDWGFSFIQYASQLLPPVDFLQMWKCYNLHHKAVTSQIVDSAIPVQPDIHVDGELRVSSPSMLSNSPRKAPLPTLHVPSPAVSSVAVSECMQLRSPRRTASPRVFATKLKELASPAGSSVKGACNDDRLRCLPEWMTRKSPPRGRPFG